MESFPCWDSGVASHHKTDRSPAQQLNPPNSSIELPLCAHPRAHRSRQSPPADAFFWAIALIALMPALHKGKALPSLAGPTGTRHPLRVGQTRKEFFEFSALVAWRVVSVIPFLVGLGRVIFLFPFHAERTQLKPCRSARPCKMGLCPASQGTLGAFAAFSEGFS